MPTIPEREQEILAFWKEHRIFEQSLQKESPHGEYVFYDGPPFATGLPHYGHMLGSIIKDVIARYWTMKGYHVRRRWGWDCHGLPIENIIEKDLKISGKNQIEKIGVDTFNKACRSKVLTYTKEWKKMVERIGRWVEFDNAYKTMDSTYMESVWWALKTIWDKGLIYEGKKVLMYCPRCETPVSKAEIAMDNSYKDITEEAITVKFKIQNPAQHNLPKNTYLLAWTTTPWTLPGNVALAVGNNIEYTALRITGMPEVYIIASARISSVLKNKELEIVREKILGKDLIGLEYEPLFDIPAIHETGKKAWYVAPADFVTMEDGTGIVHTAVVYGEDDYNLGLQINLPVVPLLNEKGHFNELAPELIRGQYFKKSEKTIKDNLESRGLSFAREQHMHSYPHCWRCDTQLYYNAISAWFINIQTIKSRLIELNEKINWYPDHLKHGRFLNILETAPDWNISRNRYWATPLPFWKCNDEQCRKTICIGSVKELKERAINFDEVYATDEIETLDLHKHLADKIKLRCDACGNEMSRIPEVIDCWVESASMPFAEFHYPFENKGVFKKRFPGQYIAEYIAQTRAWFYYMHVMATLLFDGISFEHCITTGTILNEKGEKLSKSKQNFTDPWIIIERYGVDALRFYLMSSVVMQADNLFFSDRALDTIYKKIILIVSNVLNFYKTYAPDASNNYQPNTKNSAHILDQWIIAKLNTLILESTRAMDNYDVVNTTRMIQSFVDDLSTWYLRRSRERFKTEGTDKEVALYTTNYVLRTLAQLMAPFMPFLAEHIYQSIGGNKQSVHLEDWPLAAKKITNEKIITEMETARKIVEIAHAIRSEKKIKVRQPLSHLAISGAKLTKEMLSLVADEVNVEKASVEDVAGKKFYTTQTDSDLTVALNTNITPELERKGFVRELTRHINDARKKAGLTPSDKVTIILVTSNATITSVAEEYNQEIVKAVIAKSVILKTELPKQLNFSNKLELDEYGTLEIGIVK